YDICSLGMIMWKLTSGCKPFFNVENNINLIYKILNGKQPEITQNTSATLMKSCWDHDPSK
ncbi:16344_t:CDS:1, partial [Funneliformis geosporum]